MIAWKRTAQPDQGEFGEPEILFQRGTVPEMQCSKREKVVVRE